MSQIGTYTYNAVKVLSDDYTQSFASQIKEQPPLDEDEEFITRCGFHIH